MRRRWSIALGLLWLLVAAAAGQTRPPLDLSYELSFSKPHTHLFDVRMTIGRVTTAQLDVEMPTWTPGSYLQREFARNVQDVAASSDKRPLAWRKTDKATWRITTGASVAAPRTIDVTY